MSFPHLLVNLPLDLMTITMVKTSAMALEGQKQRYIGSQIHVISCIAVEHRILVIDTPSVEGQKTCNNCVSGYIY